MLTVLGGLAGFERLSRTGERADPGDSAGGRALVGKQTQHQVAEARVPREAGKALSDIGRSYNVSHSTISRL
jgi:hypothetical protein